MHITAKHTFHYQKIHSCTYWVTIQASSYWCWKLPGLFCRGLFLRLVRYPWVLGSPLNIYISPWQANSMLKYTTCRLFDELGHGFNCFLYVEVKMTSVDAIWFFQWRHSLFPPLCGYARPPTPSPFSSDFEKNPLVVILKKMEIL